MITCLKKIMVMSLSAVFRIFVKLYIWKALHHKNHVFMFPFISMPFINTNKFFNMFFPLVYVWNFKNWKNSKFLRRICFIPYILSKYNHEISSKNLCFLQHTAKILLFLNIDIKIVLWNSKLSLISNSF